MNLLLVLSALLSALTGVGVGARLPQAEQAIARLTVAEASAPAQRVEGIERPLPGRATLREAALCSGGEPLRLTAAVPLFLSRRRE